MLQRRPSHTIPARKQQHVDLTLTKEVSFKAKTTGLEQLEFVHNALPELNLADLDTTARFLNRDLHLPFMVSCMTGGYAGARVINQKLAEVCEETGIAMGVGSQRQALEDNRYHKTFTIVREAAPSVPVIGNVGAAEVAMLTTVDPMKRLVDMLHADALAVHLNPLQEFLQPEGSPAFHGVLVGIARLVNELPVPVIVKEIGAGISSDVARRLLDVGVRYIDVAGSGGTSWAGVEALRRKDRMVASHFWDWGIPTATAVRDIAALRSSASPFTLIASGGINSGIDIAKCVALGADLCASARPVLMALHRGGKAGLRALFAQWAQELRGAMFLTGSPTLEALRHVPLVRVHTP